MRNIRVRATLEFRVKRKEDRHDPGGKVTGLESGIVRYYGDPLTPEEISEAIQAVTKSIPFSLQEGVAFFTSSMEAELEP